jgi:putative effector of murein hydrolase LrgA (UPF0299 family)
VFQETLEMKNVHGIVNWIILILAVLCVPFAHGILEYGGLIAAALLLVWLNATISRKRKKTVAN